MRNERRKLPDTRNGLTRKFKIGEHKGYITVGFFEDGMVGEIFVKMDRQGSQVSGFIDAWAIAVSMLLQSGTPLETICQKFRNMSFQPAGVTGDREIPMTKSPIDFIVRWLELRFVSVKKAS